MFLAGIGPLIAERQRPGRPATISQAEVEVACGLDRDTVFGVGGCADQAVLLDLVRFDRGRAGRVVEKERGGYTGEAGEWCLATGQFPATVCGSSSSSTTYWVSDMHDHLSTCGGELSDRETALWTRNMLPVNDIWRSLGRYGPYWWRYFSLMGPVDIRVKAGDLTRLLGVEPRTASRMLARARPILADPLTRGCTLLHGGRLVDDQTGLLRPGFGWANDRHQIAERRRKEYLRRHGGPRDAFKTDKAIDSVLRMLPDWLAWAEQVPGAGSDAIGLLRSLVGDERAVAAFLQAGQDDTASRTATVEHTGKCGHCADGRPSMKCFH